MYHGFETFGSFLVACRDASKVLEFVEEAFNQVAFTIEFLVVASLVPAVGLRWDVRLCATFFNQIKDPVGIIGAVGHDNLSRRCCLQ